MSKKTLGRRTTGKLTAKQQLFAAEYLVDLNAAQAAIRAGYAKKGARQTGHRLLTNVDIAAAVAAKQAAQLNATDLTAERVKRELAWMAFSNLQDLKDEDGNWLPMSQWPRGAAAAVARVKVRKDNLTAGDGVQEVVVDVQMWNKNQAIDSAMKHLGMLTEKHEHEGNINIGWLTDEDPDP